jgi:hypothetical protein
MKTPHLILAAAVSLLGLGAFAQTPDDTITPTDDVPTPADDRPITAPPPMADDDDLIDPEARAATDPDPIEEAAEADERMRGGYVPPSRIGIAFMAGGGFGNFFDDGLAGSTSQPGLWQVRAVVGSRRHFAGEMAYVGGAQNVYTLGVDDGATMVNNGFEGAFRWNVLTGIIQPYAVGGIGYQHYRLSDEAVQTADIQSYGDVVNFPLGVGLAVKPGPITIDGRFTFRPATNSGLLRDSNLSTWDLGAHAGFEF